MSNHSEQTQVFNASEFHVNDWMNAHGNKMEAIKLSDFHLNPEAAIGFL